jgi:hypothetical protein
MELVKETWQELRSWSVSCYGKCNLRFWGFWGDFERSNMALLA